jgi:L-asparaginase/Glu-tRNA(Gln) amidotransferase subunit D
MLPPLHHVSQVCIFFHDRLLRGNRATKVNSFTVDAFDSPNFPRLAQVAVNVVIVQRSSLQLADLAVVCWPTGFLIFLFLLSQA